MFANNKRCCIENSLDFKAIKAEEMPEKMRPIFLFYLMDNDELLESWAGISTRK